MDKDILTIDQAAKFLKINKRSIHKLIKQEKIPYKKVLNKYRFERETLKNWIRNQG